MENIAEYRKPLRDGFQRIHIRIQPDLFPHHPDKLYGILPVNGGEAFLNIYIAVFGFFPKIDIGIQCVGVLFTSPYISVYQMGERFFFSTSSPQIFPDFRYPSFSRILNGIQPKFRFPIGI